MYYEVLFYKVCYLEGQRWKIKMFESEVVAVAFARELIDSYNDVSEVKVRKECALCGWY